MTNFTPWENFYVIVGSAAGALTGLQFVVMALIVDLRINRQGGGATDAFGTPTIVHFSLVLLLSALLSVPWRGMGAPALLLALCGVAGFIYVMIVARRARRQTEYQPVFEDWLFHVFLPAAAYAILALAAAIARGRIELALFGVATSSLLLLFIGIHNAWDTVTYVVFVRGPEQRKNAEAADQRPRE